MPNIKSAKKRVKVNTAKTEQNKAQVRSENCSKKADVAVAENAADKNAVVAVAIKKVDQAAAKGLMHKNCASRKKAQLATKLNAAN